MTRALSLAGSIGVLALTAACGSGTVQDQGGAGRNDPGSGGGAGGPASGGKGNSNGGSNGSSGQGAGGTTSGGGSSISTGFGMSCTAPAKGSPTLRLLTRAELENTLNDVFPSLKGQWTNSLPSSLISEAGFDNDASVTVGDQLAGSLLDVGTAIGALVSGSVLSTLLPCSTSAADRSCAETFVNQYGKRLFRRPLTQTEHDRYLSFFDTAKSSSDFKTAIKWITVGLIQSPNAVYRSELGTKSGSVRQLSNYEIATELAYAFTGSTPSSDLLSKADANNLGDLSALAKAMLATDTGKQQLQRFFEGYLAYTTVAAQTKTNIPNFSSLTFDMIRETRAFIDDVVLSKGGGLRELLTAKTTNPSKALASYYGNSFPTPSADYASVTRPSNYGLGVLAQASFLASHANSDASSPTRRGLFAYYRLLCQGKLSPPKDVPPLSQATVTNTTRERYELAHVQPGTSCYGCHKHFDPMGFGFEHFDEGGLYRSTQNGENINSAATLLGPDDKAIFDFQGEDDLVQKLADQAVSYQCFAAYLATFAFGQADACLGPSHVADLKDGKMSIAESFGALTQEPHFTQRDAQ